MTKDSQMTLHLRRQALASVVLAATVLIAACASTVDKIQHIGQPPALDPIVVPPGLVSSPPLVTAETQPPQANSLWRIGSRSFFRDPRAAKVGDLLTVQIDI